MEKHFRLLVKNAKQVVQVCSKGERILTGAGMKKLSILNESNKDGISIVINRLVKRKL